MLIQLALWVRASPSFFVSVCVLVFSAKLAENPWPNNRSDSHLWLVYIQMVASHLFY